MDKNIRKCSVDDISAWGATTEECVVSWREQAGDNVSVREEGTKFDVFA